MIGLMNGIDSRVGDSAQDASQNASGQYGELKGKLMHAMYRFKSVGRRKHGFGPGFGHGHCAAHGQGHGSGAAHGHGSGIPDCHAEAQAIRGINMAELIFMKRIAERKAEEDYEGTWLSAMSDYLCISKAAVSQMLGSLEKKGLITREANPENRREILVSLTTEGAARVGAIQRIFDEKVDMLIDRFGEQDTKELIRLIDKMADILGETNGI
ncbi:hypothetical protein AGMMS49983_19500 [Clostridia bacterium]|nr:hypothetical protein AGMMS49983_19500 [Clostridia bacterium]